jgi:hypothetical protein
MNDFVRDKFTGKDDTIPFAAEVLAGACVSMTRRPNLFLSNFPTLNASHSVLPEWEAVVASPPFMSFVLISLYVSLSAGRGFPSGLYEPAGDCQDQTAGGRRDHDRTQNWRPQCHPRPWLVRPLQGRRVWPLRLVPLFLYFGKRKPFLIESNVFYFLVYVGC